MSTITERDPNTSVGDVLYGDGGKFFLRPDYDAVAARLGVPPLGIPAECEFSAAWPESAPEPVPSPEPVAAEPPAPRRRVTKRAPSKRAPKAIQ